MRRAGLFGLSEHLKRFSAHGDPLEVLGRIININSTGPQSNLLQTNDPLLQNLIKKGLAQPDSLGLGLSADQGGV